jgi:uncharacterized protein involved in exopolysaccharide biosynthesis
LVSARNSSADPKFAALAANTTSELYILDQLSSKGEATSRAGDFLSARVNEQRRQLDETLTALIEERRNLRGQALTRGSP